MRRFQKPLTERQCTVRVDVVHPQHGEVIISQDEFSKFVSSSQLIDEVRRNLELLFGVSGPHVQCLAANTTLRAVQVSVSGGEDGVECLRAACAAVSSMKMSHVDSRLEARLTVVRTAR